MCALRLTIFSAYLLLAISNTGAAANGGPAGCAGSHDIALVNGRIITMDPSEPMVSSVLIRNGRFAVVGGGAPALGPCARTINLHGRIAIPGLIDQHMHWVRHGLIRPGHDVREIETAFSIAEVQEVLAARAAELPVPDVVTVNDFLTAVRGWNFLQFEEDRFPTLAELDAAVPDHPVYLQQGGSPGITNTLGKLWFEANTAVTVAPDGMVSSANMAFNALLAAHTFENKVRATREFMDWSASVGLTTVRDTSGLSDTFRDYDALLELERAGDVITRVRILFRHAESDVSPLIARVDNAFHSFGSDMVRVAGLGENIVSGGASLELFTDASSIAAAHGWTFAQHSSSLDENDLHLTAFEAVVAGGLPIANLHWSLEHVFSIDDTLLDRAISLGVGAGVQNQRYLCSSGPDAGPPFRRIVDSGIKVGAGTDATNVAAANPWLSIFYMVTGKNCDGVVINAGQTLTRMEALRLYTIGSAWFSKEENVLGSIEVGKAADIVVLSDDYLSVPEDDIRRLTSVLTIVNGNIVHNDSGF